MSTFKRVKNEYTGEIELQGPMTLKSLPSDKVLTNSNGTNYRLCSVEFVNAQGEIVTRTAKIWESNYNLANKEGGLTQGEDYLSRIQMDSEGNYWITMSHLRGANRASEEDFGKFFMEQVNSLPVGKQEIF